MLGEYQLSADLAVRMPPCDQKRDLPLAAAEADRCPAIGWFLRRWRRSWSLLFFREGIRYGLFQRHRAPLRPRRFPRLFVQLGTGGGEVGTVKFAFGGSEGGAAQSIRQRLSRPPQPS